MNKKTLFSFVLFSLAITGCTPKEPIVNPLEAPVISLNSEKTGLVWTTNEKAVSYEISVNEADPTPATAYSFSETVGNYSIRVRAIAENEKENSEFSTPFTYTTKATMLGDLAFANSKITWASLDAAGLEVSVNGGAFSDVTTDSFDATSIGNYIFRTKTGYVEATNTFYVNSTEKNIFATAPIGTGSFVLEDASAESDADLQDAYTVKKYDNGWKDSTAAISKNNSEYGEYGDCVEFQYWRHGAYFSYEKAMSLDKTYNTIEFAAKGNDVSDMTIYFGRNAELTVGGLSLKGVYLSYTMTSLPKVWKNYSIPLAAEGWKVDYNGMKLSFNDIKPVLASAGVHLNSLAELLPMFDSFAFRWKASSDSNGSTVRSYVANARLTNTDLTASQTSSITFLAEKYTLKNVNMDVELKADKKVVISNTTLPVQILTINWELDALKTTLTITCSTSSAEFVWTGITEDCGVSFKCTGLDTLAPQFSMLENDLIPVVTHIDGFESYSETGKGYDANNKSMTNLTGLRSAYFADYYSGNQNNQSPVGGNNWSLMGSTDYLSLDTSVAHTGTKSAKMKASTAGAMRYTTIALATDLLEPVPFEKADTFSFWAKGTEINITLKVGVYTLKTITPSTQGDSSKRAYKEFTIPANSDWTQYTITLDESKTYYGFAMTAASTNKAVYFHVDDISAYMSSFVA